MGACSSQSRCCQVSCRKCSKRYATRLARRILATAPRRLFSVEFATTLSPVEFRLWRICTRNTIDGQRRGRVSHWWSDVSLCVWLGQDGRVRGITSLGSITEAEFADAFARWPVTLRRIELHDLRAEVHAVIRPGMIASLDGPSRYQRVKFTLWPKRRAQTRPRQSQASFTLHREIAPMPVIF
jgi:hypothetical protein